MTKQREPQVGDVYIFPSVDDMGVKDYTNKIVRVVTKVYIDNVVFDGIGILYHKVCFLPFIKKLKWVTGMEFLDCPYNPIEMIKRYDWIYAWRYAPRYKRLFGIYYIKDKDE